MSSKDIICNTYRVLKQLGAGGFSKVYKCITLDTKEIVAVKVIPIEFAWYAENELNALMQLRRHGQHDNLLSLNRHFITPVSYILEFDMLDMTLDDLISKIDRPLYLNEIQEITQQIVMALKTLSNICMLHLDIKPDNIMLVDHKRWPFKVKLIDLGLAFSVDKLTTGYKIQTLNYRAPEVILGLPLNEAIDMWSLGCVVAFMFFGEDFHAACCEFDRVREMVSLQGQPEDTLLNSGIYSSNFFSRNVQSLSWELRENCDCHVNGHSTTNNVLPSLLFQSLEEIMEDYPNATEKEEMPAFTNLVKQMMEVDPGKRITPENALRHSFLKGKHFPRNCDMTKRRTFTIETNITTNDKCRLELPAVKSELKSRIHMKEASNTNLDDSHSVQEETATCTRKERRLPKTPKKPNRKAKSTTRIEVASSTKSEDSLSDRKRTAASINAECNLQKAPEKLKRKGKSRIHMKEASNTNLDDSHSVHEETASCIRKKRRLPKPPKKPNSKAKSTTRIEVGSSTKSEDSLSDRKRTAASINAECNLQKAPEKLKRKGKSRIHMKEASNTNLDDSHSVQEETASCIRKKRRLPTPPKKPNSKAKSTKHIEGASSTPSPIVVAFMKTRRFFKSLFTCFKS